MIKLNGVMVYFYLTGMRSAGRGEASIQISDARVPEIVIESPIPDGAVQMQFGFSMQVAGHPETVTVYSQVMEISGKGKVESGKEGENE